MRGRLGRLYYHHTVAVTVQHTSSVDHFKKQTQKTMATPTTSPATVAVVATAGVCAATAAWLVFRRQRVSFGGVTSHGHSTTSSSGNSNSDAVSRCDSTSAAPLGQAELFAAAAALENGLHVATCELFYFSALLFSIFFF